MLPALLGSAGLLLAAPAQGQIALDPNLNFENWVQRNTAVAAGVEAPQNWQTFDDLLSVLAESQLPLTTATTTKTIEDQNGTFAVKIENKAYAPLQSLIPVLSGVASLGNGIKFSTTGDEFTGIPCTSRPTQLQFYYQLTGPAAARDSAAVFFALTRNVSGETEDVTFFGVLLPPAANYTLVSLPIRYTNNITPDSLHLTFTSGNARRPTAGTTLLVDNITLVTSTATPTRSPALAAAVSIYPNPSPDGRYVLNATEPVLLAAPLTVLDATGRVVRREPAPSAAPTRTLDMSDLAKGIYTLQLATAKGLITKRLVVQ
ncbi:T9SS type A sorting domain-containing protein [Hymenobacter arizonensis]|uniref:Por secretion system C-terminal sorting domain-containing protein n=1 Tax=Hymenobacter arizonensis TaxID=1227077 RepID=A0A1I6ASJ7_HYMAR|nr:T9SS type A sorting domain-containing protein [Hymenobacter arizonensis]SFQ71681.1 Por secretion system C-terminal sorting domain-containing protein [Hymenobacter arizonensis]